MTSACSFSSLALGSQALWYVAIHMLYEFHLSVYREPVGMYVPEAHEDGNHQSLVIKVWRIIYFFYYHNLAIGRSYDELLSILYVQVADRAAIEIEHDAVNHTEDNQENPEWNFGVKSSP